MGDSLQKSEGGMKRLETLTELTFLNSSFSSLSSYILKFDKQLPLEQFEATSSQSTVLSPPLKKAQVQKAAAAPPPAPLPPAPRPPPPPPAGFLQAPQQTMPHRMVRPISVRTKIVDFRGFDSSIILLLWGGILMSIGISL